MTTPRIPPIAIAVEGGDWPAKPALRTLARKAVTAAVEALERETGAGAAQPLSPLPGPPAQEGGAAKELSILFTNDEAIRALNTRWRGIDKATNVLSFPAAGGLGLPSPLPDPSGKEGAASPPLGDIALAAETTKREAALAEIPLESHIAHLIIHGFFHLLGYDHQEDEEAEAMEALERAALTRIGIADPYAAARRR